MNKTNLINSIYKMWVAINWIATWYLEHQMIISLVVDIIEMILWLYDKDRAGCKVGTVNL